MMRKEVSMTFLDATGPVDQDSWVATLRTPRLQDEGALSHVFTANLHPGFRKSSASGRKILAAGVFVSLMVSGVGFGGVQEEQAYLMTQVQNHDPAIRAAAVSGLERARQTTADVETVLLAGVQDPDPGVRYQSIHALAFMAIDGDKSVPAILARARDRDPHVREMAVYALGMFHIQNDDRLRVFIRALSDIEPDVRGSAIWALTSFGPDGRTAISTLVRLLKSPDPLLRRDAADGLLQLHATEAIGALQQAMTDKDPDAHPMIAQAYITLKAMDLEQNSEDQ